MFICENINLTVGIYSASYDELLHIKDNCIYGLIGKYQQKLIESRKSKPFNCKLILEDDIGSRLKNGSYTGAIKQVRKRSMDIFLRHLSGYVDTDLIDLTPVINSEKYLIIQMFEDEPILNENRFFFSLFDIKYLIFVLLNLLIFFLIILLIAIGLKKRNKIPFIFDSIINFNRNQIKWIKILSITYIIFNFITKQVFFINIKTSKVIVDTSSLLLNEQRIFESNLKVIWIKGEREDELCMTAPKETFLNNLYKYKNYNPPVILNKDDLAAGINLIKNGFLFLNENAARAAAFYLNKYLNIKIFVNENPFFLTTNYFYRIKEKSLKTKFIDENVKMIFEHGIFIKYIIDVSSLNLIKTKDKNPVYYSIDEYLENFTIFEKITLNNLFYLFAIYLIVNILILITFILFKLKHLIFRSINYLAVNLVKFYKNFIIKYLKKFFNFCKSRPQS